MQIAALEKELNYKMFITQILDYKNEGFVDGNTNHDSRTKPVEVGKIVPDITVNHCCKIIYNEIETCNKNILKVTGKPFEEIIKEGQSGLIKPCDCNILPWRTLSTLRTPINRRWLYI